MMGIFDSLKALFGGGKAEEAVPEGMAPPEAAPVPTMEAPPAADLGTGEPAAAPEVPAPEVTEPVA